MHHTAIRYQSIIAQALITVIVVWNVLGGISVANGMDVGSAALQQHITEQQHAAAGMDTQGHSSCDSSQTCGTTSVVDCLAHCITTAPAAHVDTLLIVSMVLFIVAALQKVVPQIRQFNAPSLLAFLPLYQFATVHLKE